MATKSHVQIELQAETVELFDRYHKYTGTTPELYITQLVEKTLPTVQAMVDAMDEASASENPDEVDVMELFSRKMATAAMEQQKASQADPIKV
ncbi:MAG: hypothetical protein ACPGF7_10465 [Pontibacterium sp.]